MMNPAVQNQALLSMLNEIYSQLDEIETAIENTYGELSNQWTAEERKKITIMEQKFSKLENKAIQKRESDYQLTFNFELGF